MKLDEVEAKKIFCFLRRRFIENVNERLRKNLQDMGYDALRQRLCYKSFFVFEEDASLDGFPIWRIGFEFKTYDNDDDDDDRQCNDDRLTPFWPVSFLHINGWFMRFPQKRFTAIIEKLFKDAKHSSIRCGGWALPFLGKDESLEEVLVKADLEDISVQEV